MEQHPQWEEPTQAPSITPKMTPQEAVQFQLQKTEAKPLQLRTKEDGIVDTTDLEGQKIFATRLIQEGLISSTFKNAQQVILGFQFCKELNLPIMVGMRMLYVVKGRPSLWGDGPLALCQRSGQVESFREFFVDEDGEEICVKNKNLKKKVWAAVTQVKRSGDPELQEDYFSVEDIKTAGLDQDKFGKKDTYTKFERNMMRYKARTMALKTKFSDMISGVNIAEYHDHFDPSLPEMVLQKPTLVAEIEQYGKAEENSGQEVAQ